MEWREIGTFTLGSDWQYSERCSGNDFKIVYLSSTLLGRDSVGTIALCDIPANEATLSTEFFKPQRISAYLPSEIIRFPVPPREWDYRLAIKRLGKTNLPVPDLNIKIYMPAYSSSPIFNGATNDVTATTVATDSTKSITLSAANPNKIGTVVTNNSPKSKLYISVGIAASLTVYDKILNYLESYETPFNWRGDVFGIWDKPDTMGSAKVKDFS